MTWISFLEGIAGGIFGTLVTLGAMYLWTYYVFWWEQRK